MEKPAPPRPRRFAGLHLVDDPVGTLREAFLDGFVAAKFEVAVDVGRAHAEAAGDDLDFIGMGDEPRHFFLVVDLSPELVPR